MDLDTKRMMRVARAILSGDVDFAAPARRSSGIPLFVAGLATGVVLGVLFAPGAGEDTRTQIADRARQGYDSAKSKGREFGRKAQEAVDRGKDRINETVATARENHPQSRNTSLG